MRVVPAIRQRVPAPSLSAIIRLRLNLWRLRRISAGLERAQARGDEAGFSRWLARGFKACDDLEASRLSCKAPRRGH